MKHTTLDSPTSSETSTDTSSARHWGGGGGGAGGGGGGGAVTHNHWNLARVYETSCLPENEHSMLLHEH